MHANEGTGAGGVLVPAEGLLGMDRTRSLRGFGGVVKGREWNQLVRCGQLAQL